MGVWSTARPELQRFCMRMEVEPVSIGFQCPGLVIHKDASNINSHVRVLLQRYFLSYRSVALDERGMQGIGLGPNPTV